MADAGLVPEEDATVEAESKPPAEEAPPRSLTPSEIAALPGARWVGWVPKDYKEMKDWIVGMRCEGKTRRQIWAELNKQGFDYSLRDIKGILDRFRAEIAEESKDRMEAASLNIENSIAGLCGHISEEKMMADKRVSPGRIPRLLTSLVSTHAKLSEEAGSAAPAPDASAVPAFKAVVEEMKRRKELREKKDAKRLEAPA